MTSGIRRRTLLQGVAAGAAVTSFSIGRARAQSGPIRLGFSAPLSGSQQIVGTPLRIGAEVARDQINAAGGVNGRMIELVVRDDKGDPAQAVANVRELTGAGVNLIAGIPLTATAMAVAGVIQSVNGVYIVTGSGEEKLTHELFTRHLFTAAENNLTRLTAFSEQMARRFPEATTWGAIFPDITVGHSSWKHMSSGLKKFHKSLNNKDVTILDPVLTKFGATDYKSQIVALMSSGAQAFHSVLFGGDAVTFFQQAQPFGLAKKVSVISDQSLDVELPRALKRNTPGNVWSASFWYPGSFPNNPESDALLKGYIERAGNPYPPALTALSHTAIKAYATAIKMTNGSTDTGAVIAALEEAKFETAKGPAFFRKEDHMIMTQGSFLRADPAQNEQGWEIKDAIAVDLKPFVEPATPGVAIKG
jgi:branched-chain amino acid transport system substrate-binding protein